MSIAVDLSPISDPFPHRVVDEFWPDHVLSDVAEEFPDSEHPGWRRYANAQEGKFEGPPAIWGEVTRSLFDSIAELAEPLGKAFGIPGLTMETIGGGYHLIPPGGRLAVHTDFNVSPDSHLYRRLNLIIYLNRDWDDPGGCLELWDEHRRTKAIVPEFGRMVVFETSDRSWHGHPKPTEHRWRRSVAAYFFSPEPAPGYSVEHSTIWHPRGT